MSELQRVESLEVAPDVAMPPPPGQESAGPALTALAAELAIVRANQDALLRRAELAAQRDRIQLLDIPIALDGAGNLSQELYRPPGGAKARLERLVVELAGRTFLTAAVANAFVELRKAPRPLVAGAGTQGPLGSLLDAAPPIGFVAGDTGARFPVIASYSDRVQGPTVTGPDDGFFLLIGGSAGALAGAQGSVHLQLLLDEVV